MICSSLATRISASIGTRSCLAASVSKCAGAAEVLKVNYRTTDEIRRWACAQLEGCAIDDLDGNIDTLRGYHSLTHGDRPDVIESTSYKDDVKHIKAILKQLADDAIEPRQVCIAARTNDDVDSVVRGPEEGGDCNACAWSGRHPTTHPFRESVLPPCTASKGLSSAW
jgi:hypothetical protein